MKTYKLSEDEFGFLVTCLISSYTHTIEDMSYYRPRLVDLDMRTIINSEGKLKIEYHQGFEGKNNPLWKDHGVILYIVGDVRIEILVNKYVFQELLDKFKLEEV